LQGDSRQLDNVLADCAIFSPPYAETEAQISADKFADPVGFAKVSSQRFRDGKKKGHFASKEAILRAMEKRQKGYSDNPNQIGSLPYGEIDKIICSPPYNAEPTCSEKYKKIRTETGRDIAKPSSQYTKYSDKPDVICTSTPYGETIAKGQGGKTPERLRSFIGESCFNSNQGYSESNNNIGNLKSDNYLSAMAQVYQQCCKVLKDGGLMILVVKNFIRDKKIVRIDLDTIKLCENAGFILTERLARKLTQMSFWRRIYMQKYPDAPRIDFEDVLIFKKNS